MSALVTSLHAGALAATAATIEAWGITVLVSVAIGCVNGLLTGIFAWLDAVTSVFLDFARVQGHPSQRTGLVGRRVGQALDRRRVDRDRAEAGGGGLDPRDVGEQPVVDRPMNAWS
jgi:hypothetical protein